VLKKEKFIYKFVSQPYMQDPDQCMDEAYAMADALSLALPGTKDDCLFVIGGSNGQLNRIIDYKIFQGRPRLLDFPTDNGIDKLVAIHDQFDDGILDSTQILKFELQQAIVFLSHPINGDGNHHYNRLQKEYEDNSRLRFHYLEVEEEFVIEGRYVCEREGIIRLKNPVLIDTEYGDEFPSVYVFKQGFIRRTGTVISNEQWDLDSIKDELWIEPRKPKTKKRHLQSV